jgi:hypothetical protein
MQSSRSGLPDDRLGAGRIQTRKEHLIKIDERLNGLILPNYSLPQFLLK